MVFSSILFLFCFLPLFVLTYHFINKRYKNYVLLIFSLLFYAWGAPKFIFFLLFSLLINFYVVKALYIEKKYKKLLLITSLFINIGLLAYFKYANFFIENVSFLLNTFNVKGINWVKIALPIGISFFTFQSITYTVDVYRNVHKPLNKLSDYLLYILMFPQLIAGPIVRFNTVADDIEDRQANETYDNKLYGIFRFTIGLSKKVLLANILGEQVDNWLSLPLSEIDTGISWLAMIAYSFQIYFDFSGYSDMAIGLGRIIGFKFPENFNNPYVAKNITEFWKRWHISLSTWFRDYLFLPLAYSISRKLKNEKYLNVRADKFIYLIATTITFLLCGFWHGAAWNFVIWGAWHGLFLILDKVFLIKFLKKVGTIPRVIINYVIILIGWVFFRIESFSEAVLYLKKMFRFDFFNSGQINSEFIMIMLFSVIISFSTLLKAGRNIENIIYTEKRTIKGNIFIVAIAIVLFLLSASYITSFGFNPFIYFRF